jgi:DNA repair exonuclease SbcCD ATPase subunit
LIATKPLPIAAGFATVAVTMKRPLPLILLCALCACVASKAFAADDPGAQFVDARFLVQDGDDAAAKGDWATAHAKYSSALKILQAIRSQSPEWNANVVEYRIKYCTEHLESLKDKLPAVPPPPAEPPPAPAAPAAPITPAPPSAEAEQLKQLTAQLARAQQDVRRLESDRDALHAKLQEALKKPAAPEPPPRVKDLQKQNKELSAQLASAQKRVTELEKKAAAPPPAPPAESAELKKLRAQLADARAETERAKKSSQRVAELEKQNKELTAKLDAAQKQPAAPKTVARPADTDEVRKLRADLAEARIELDRAKTTSQLVNDLQKQNKELATKLAAAEKKTTPAKAAPPAESAELKKLRTELAEARAETERAKKSSQRVAELEKQNKDLTAKLAAAEKEPAPAKRAAAPSESAELKKLRAELADARAETERAKKAGQQVADLQKQNKELAAKLAAAEKMPAPAKAAAPAESAELKKLRTELADARAETERAKKAGQQVADLQKQNKELAAKLEAAQKQAAVAVKPAPAPGESAELKKLRAELANTRAELAAAKKRPATPGEPRDVRKLREELNETKAASDKDAELIKNLREENSRLRHLLETYAATIPELKGQLRRHSPRESTKTEQP